jgi:hypothetical protein
MLTIYIAVCVFGCSVVAILIRSYNAIANILIFPIYTCDILHKTSVYRPPSLIFVLRDPVKIILLIKQSECLKFAGLFLYNSGRNKADYGFSSSYCKFCSLSQQQRTVISFHNIEMSLGLCWAPLN